VSVSYEVTFTVEVVFHYSANIFGDDSFVEITIGQVCACLPMTNFLVEKLMKNRKSAQITKRNQPSSRLWKNSHYPLLWSWPSIFKNSADDETEVGADQYHAGGDHLYQTLHDEGRLISNNNIQFHITNPLEYHPEQLSPATITYLSVVDGGQTRGPTGIVSDHTRTPSELLIPDRIWDGITRGRVSM
jgi:hypothetical protein